MELLQERPVVGQPQGNARLRPGLKATEVWVGSQPHVSALRKTPLVHTSLTYAAGVRGRVVVFSSSSTSTVKLTDSRFDILPNGGDFTIAVLRRSKDTTARNSTLFGYNNISSDRVLAHAPYGDGTLYWDAGNNTAGSGRISVSFTKSTNWETLVFYAGSRGREVWRNGVRIANSTTALATLSGSTAVPVYIGASAGNNSDNDEIALFVVGGGHDWSVAECKAWGLDPYGQTFAPLEEFGLEPSAAGGSSTLTADSQSYTLTGVAAALKAARLLTAEQQSYALTGVAAGLTVQRLLTATQQTYTLSGVDATLTYSGAGSKTLTADIQSYTLTGVAAGLTVARKLTADQQSYTLTGNAAGLSHGYVLTATAASFTLAGQDVAFGRTYAITAESQSYALNGSDAGLTYSGGPAPAPAPAQKGAGRSRRRRPHVVEIDGEDFIVGSAEEAQELLERAKEEAAQVAKVAIERASKVRNRPVRKVLADARKAMQVPAIDAPPDLEAYADQITRQIESLYADALRTIEIAALIAKREREDEDDEDVLLLMA